MTQIFKYWPVHPNYLFITCNTSWINNWMSGHPINWHPKLDIHHELMQRKVTNQINRTYIPQQGQVKHCICQSSSPTKSNINNQESNQGPKITAIYPLAFSHSGSRTVTGFSRDYHQVISPPVWEQIPVEIMSQVLSVSSPKQTCLFNLRMISSIIPPNALGLSQWHTILHF